MRLRSALLAVAVAFAVSLPLTAQNQTPPNQASHPHREMPRPKNLQVLPKDISGPQLIATMRGFTKALGVECSFCHAQDPQTHRPDFASDAKPDKTTARTMMRMTEEINAKYLSTVNDPDAAPDQKTVTCGTCHRGQSMPAPFHAPAGMEEHHKAPAQS